MKEIVNDISSNLSKLDDRLRGVEQSLSTLATEVKFLSNSDALNSVKKTIDQIQELRLENDSLFSKVEEFGKWQEGIDSFIRENKRINKSRSLCRSFILAIISGSVTMVTGGILVYMLVPK